MQARKVIYRWQVLLKKLASAWVFTTTFLCYGQNTPSYEVVSIRSSAGTAGMVWDARNDQLTAHSVTVAWVLQRAFNLSSDRFDNVPTWVNDDLFDFNAKVDTPTGSVSAPPDGPVTRARLQAMLAERLAFRFENTLKVQKVWVISKQIKAPPRLKLSSDQEPTEEIGNGHLGLRGATLDDFSQALSISTSLPVLNETSIKGRYDIDLSWDANPFSDSQSRSLPEAIREDLRLKYHLEARPVPTIKVTAIKKPSEN